MADECCPGGDCAPKVDRRDFVRLVGLGLTGPLATGPAGAAGPVNHEGAPNVDAPDAAAQALAADTARLTGDLSWPALRVYDRAHLARIAMPLGGIGTGTVSLGGRGDLRDWELMNRPGKGFVPAFAGAAPFLALFTQRGSEPSVCRILEGPVDADQYEGSHGAPGANLNLPRFRNATFATAYPFGRVVLSDPAVPIEVHLKAFNPLVPTDAEASSLPLASITIELRNATASTVTTAVCATLPNFIGCDGSQTTKDWKGDRQYVGAKQNRNALRDGDALAGVLMTSAGVDPVHEAWGSMALATTATAGVSRRTSWVPPRWGVPLLDFWDDFAADGRLDAREGDPKVDTPVASLAVTLDVPAGATRDVTFLLAWHFPNRYTWTPAHTPPSGDDRIGNHYTTRYADAWEVLARETPRLASLKARTAAFVNSVCGSDLPAEVKEAALFNVSTLRTQTCFRTPDGTLFGWEGVADTQGCCHGSCTHVWNYEQATAFLFGDLAWSMREVEFGPAIDEQGMVSFRVHLPLSRGRSFGKAAADGQMGCVMKVYRDWQLSGRDADLRRLWPAIRRSVEFCWIAGGWDADRDGVMEGCQHNTMDVEYYGPNPQMGLWYLGALRAAEEMAKHLGDATFATTCHDLYTRGRAWTDAHLFNGEYYEHKVQPPSSPSAVAPSLLVGMGAKDPTRPEFQLGEGCLVDQLVGQYMARVCHLGSLVDAAHARTTLQSILKYNLRTDLHAHFNNMRVFAMADDAALLMASYPKGRPDNPFPYFTEVMTGFEYTAAVGMLYEGLEAEGLRCIAMIRARYDGQRRNPFDEAECGHHYARAMASWAAILALTSFHYSAVTKTLEIGARPGRFPWSTGRACGEMHLARQGPNLRDLSLTLTVHEGSVAVEWLKVEGRGVMPLRRRPLVAGERIQIAMSR
jgi:non-lysosomal glucosylceramidase